MSPTLCLGHFNDVFQLVLENPWDKMQVVKKQSPNYTCLMKINLKIKSVFQKCRLKSKQCTLMLITKVWLKC